MLLCLDSAGWTAIFTLLLVLVTGALVVVTWRLWTTAQQQLSEQRRTTIILYRPFLRIEDAKLVATSDANGVDGIACKLVNGGKSAAWKVRMIGSVFVNRVLESPRADMQTAHLAADESYTVILPLKISREVLEGGHPQIEFEIKFIYNDLEREGNRFSFVGRYDYDKDSWAMHAGGFIEPWEEDV